MVRRIEDYWGNKLQWIFKNILCYGSAICWHMYPYAIKLFKNILCYGSALPKSQSAAGIHYLKTSYVMVRRL